METSEVETEFIAGTSGNSKGSAVRKGLSLPPELVLVEQVTADLRHVLADEDLEAYTVFVGLYDDLHDLDRHLNDLDIGARWVGQDILTGHCESPGLVVRGTPQRVLPSGLLILSRYELLVVRKFWLDRDGDWRTLFVCAASSPAEYDRFRHDV